jgi:cysteinyl-tRNA synthetase
MAVALELGAALAGCSSKPAGTDGAARDARAVDMTSRDSNLADGAARADGAAATDGVVYTAGPGRGFPMSAPWVSFYGTDTQMGNLAQAASTFRILNIDADPDAGNFTPAEIATLKNGGQNRVISYLDVGSCEMFRSYWSQVPAGFTSCSQARQLGPYGPCYPNEVWMALDDPAYQKLIVDYVAPRLAAQGVDGFFLDNLELVEHGSTATYGPCDAACSQGGLDLVGALRAAFPDMLIVMQNGTSDVTRTGHTSSGVSFPSLLDGISHEEVYFPPDTTAQSELAAWQTLGLTPGGRPFWIATEDYVGNCTDATDAMSVYAMSRAGGYSPYATDASGGQMVICYWGF